MKDVEKIGGMVYQFGSSPHSLTLHRLTDIGSFATIAASMTLRITREPS